MTMRIDTGGDGRNTWNVDMDPWIGLNGCKHAEFRVP